MQPRDPKRDARLGEAKNLMRRKRIQLEHTREYDEAIVTLKQKVRVWGKCGRCGGGCGLVWWYRPAERGRLEKTWAC